MRYETVEMGIYQVKMDCDLEASLDRIKNILEIRPLQGCTPISTHTGIHSLAGQGYFASQSVFRVSGMETAIDYRLHIEASLPIPLALRLVPLFATNRLARIITQRRMVEIADGFIENSIRAFSPLIKLTH
jgi:hypothetical protein